MTFLALMSLLFVGLYAGLPEPGSPMIDYLPLPSNSIYADIEQVVPRMAHLSLAMPMRRLPL